MAIRILRVIEYVYENEEVMSRDMLHWTHVHKTESIQMRSATLQPESFPWVDTEKIDS
jgi:hypothetical protein